jgi:hypothetical protein
MVQFGFFWSGLNFLGKESLAGGGFGLAGSIIFKYCYFTYYSQTGIKLRA